MAKRRALLVVAGGRALPDVTALFYVQPELVAFLTSEEGWRSEEMFVSIAQSLPGCKNIHAIHEVNAYNFESGKRACEQICETYPEVEWEWIFTISSAPKITGIAAYEVAREKGIPCLVIDTQHEKFVPLVKEFKADVTVNERELFHPDLAKYMQIQRRTYRNHKKEMAKYRAMAEDWAHIARELASPDARSFTSLMRAKPTGKRCSLPADLIGSPLLHALEEQELIETGQDKEGGVYCSFKSSEAARFAGTGDWLEVFVWHEAKEVGFADDCQWGYEIIDGKAENELDLALTYKAQLLIGECKTDENPFKGKREYLDILEANAYLLGGSFVTKLFITNRSETLGGYDSFKEQADKRHIVVVTAENLLHIGEILKQQAETPKYPRI